MRINKVLSLFYIVGAVVFANALFNSFVWLDNVYVVNSSLTSAHLLELFKGHVATAQDYYRPLNAVYYYFLNLIFNQSPFFYHLVQVSIFIYNAYLVYLIFRHFLSERTALLLGLLYLVHPLNEIVAVYVSASADVLYIFFGLQALLLVLNKEKSRFHYVALSLLLLCSVLSKEMGILFLIFIPFYEFLFHRKKTIMYIFISLVVLIVYLLLRYFMNGFAFMEIDLYPFTKLSFLQRIINVPEIIFYYFYSFIHPKHFGVNNLWVVHGLTWRRFYLPLAIDLFLLALQLSLGYYFYRRDKKQLLKFIFFFIIFWASLSVFFQLLFPLTNTVASRWFYLPMIGILAIFGLRIDMKMSHVLFKKVVSVLFIIIIAICGLRTIQRNYYLSDDLTFFSHFAQQNNKVSNVKNNFDLEFNLANAFFNRKDYENARIHAEKSVKMFPYDQNLTLLGYIYEREGNVQKAKEFYLKGFSADNFSPQRHSLFIYKLIAVFFINQEDYNIAQKVLRNGINDFPSDGYFRTLLAITLYKQNLPDQAMQAINEAEDLSPDTPFIDEIKDAISGGKPLHITINPF